MAHLAAHAHHEHVAAVAELDDVAGHAEAGNEHGGPAVDDVGDLGHHVLRSGGEQIDAEGLVGALAHRRDLSVHLLVAHRRRAEAPEAPGLRHGGDEAVVGDASHAGQHHRVLDLQDIGQSRAHGGMLTHT